MEASAIEVRLRNHDARLESHHNALGTLRSASSRHETEIKVMDAALRETRDDIADIKRDLGDARVEQKNEMAWVRRGLWAAAATFMMFFVAAATLIVQLSGG
jgi:hypothetical protein